MEQVTEFSRPLSLTPMFSTYQYMSTRTALSTHQGLMAITCIADLVLVLESNALGSMPELNWSPSLT